MKRSSLFLVTTGYLLLLSSCAQVDKTRSEIDDRGTHSKQVMAEPVRVAPEPRVIKNPRPYLPLSEKPLPRAGSWLRSKTVSISIGNSVPMTEIVDLFASRGVNIISEIPLGSTYYAGTIPTTDAETALQIILGYSGLDFVADEAARIVRIKPMPSKTWFINLGQRRSRYATGGSGGASSGGGASGGAAAASAGPAPSTGGASAGGASGGGSSGGEVSISSSEDFWASLQTELDRRVNVLVPSSRAPRSIATKVDSPAANSGQPLDPSGASSGSPFSTPPSMPGNAQGATTGQQQAQAAPAGSQDLYSRKMIGSYSINAETGSVSVQAPHWVLAELDAYFTRVQQMYNTDITFTGELVLVNKRRSDSEGLDLKAFVRYANRVGAVVSNNSLGGVTVSFAQGSKIPGVVAGNAVVGGPLIGITDSVDGLQLFNAWLAETGEASVIQRPVVSTTSGMPAEFSKTVTTYYNTVNQQTSAGGTGSAAVGTQNTLVPVNLGTTMRINPRFDLTTGLIRTQIAFTQSVQSGSQNINQSLTVGDQLQNIPSSVPVVTQIAYSGETLLRNGDLIIVGGQSEENLSTDQTGLPDTSNFMNYLLGTKRARREGGTFYLALRVQITPR